MIIYHTNTCNGSICLNYQTFFKLYNLPSLQTSKNNIMQCIVNSVLEKFDFTDYPDSLIILKKRTANYSDMLTLYHFTRCHIPED